MSTLVSQYDHDQAVRHYALRFLSDGYDVRARVEGWFDPPDYINGYRPDIVAIRGNECIIIEIQKGEVDWPKLLAFERFRQEHQEWYVQVITAEQVRSFHKAG